MGHGDHWGAIDKDVEIYIETMLPVICKEGQLVGENTFSHCIPELEHKEGVVYGFQYPDPNSNSPLAFLVLAVDGTRQGGSKEVWTAYPVCAEGPCTRLEVDEVKIWENGIEGAIDGYFPDGDMICFFDPFFFLNKEKYTQWAEVDIALSALAYVVEKVDPNQAEDSEEPPVSEEPPSPSADSEAGPPRPIEASEVATAETPREETAAGAEQPDAGLTPGPYVDLSPPQYFPCGEKGDSAEIEFLVEEAIPVACVGRLFWRMTGVIMRADDAKEMRIHVYASEEVLKGYVPQPGDDVMAVAWIQGRLLAVAPSTEAEPAGQ